MSHPFDPFATCPTVLSPCLVWSPAISWPPRTTSSAPPGPPTVPPGQVRLPPLHLCYPVPQYRLNIQAGTALGEAEVQRWDKVLLNQGEILIMLSTTHHHGIPPPPPQAKTCNGPSSPIEPPTRGMQMWCPTLVSSTPPLTQEKFGDA